MTDGVLRTSYEDVKEHSKADWKGRKTGRAIIDLARVSLGFLTNECELVELVSMVAGKQYVSFKRKGIVARPANRALFVPDAVAVSRLWKKWEDGSVSKGEFSRMSYTVALAPCLAMELFDRQNKKGPATYFECYIGHMFSKALQVNPQKKVRLPVHGQNVLMTMDFLFDLGKGRGKVHLPVKMSTRERVVQAWAHQRVLDSGYGKGAYKGIMVLFSETKLNSKTLEVIEICVPEQWLVYQSLLAQMDRVYYFDLPARYAELTKEFPDVIAIKEFGEFFSERGEVLGH